MKKNNYIGSLLYLMLSLLVIASCKKIANQKTDGYPTEVFSVETQIISQDLNNDTIIATEESDFFEIPDNNKTILELKPTGQYGKGSITDISWSPDGNTFAVATTIGIEILDGVDYLELLTIRTQSPIRDIEFSPKGKELASVNIDGNVEIWNVTTGSKLEELAGEEIESLAYSNDGSILALGGMGKVIFWNLEKGDYYTELTGDFGYARGLSFSPTEEILAVGVSIGKVILWNLATHTTEREVGWVSAAIFEVIYSPDGKFLAFGGPSMDIHLWDVESESIIAKIETCDYGLCDFSFSFSSNGNTIASGSLTGLISIWDSNTGNLIKTINAHAGDVTNIEYSLNGTVLVTGGKDGAMRVWDENTYTLLHEEVEYPNSIISIALSQDGTSLATGDYNSVWLWDVDNGERSSQLMGHSERWAKLAFSPNGNFLASGTHDGKIILWDLLQKKKTVLAEELEIWVTALSFSPDSTLLASAVAEDIYVWNEKSGENKFLGASGDWVVRLLVSEDNSKLVSLNRSGIFEVWDIAAAKLENTYSCPENCIPQDVVYKDNHFIASGYQGNTLYIWDILTSKIIRTINVDSDDHIAEIKLSLNGEILAVYNESKIIQLWDIESGLIFAELTGIIMDLESLVISSDNTTLFSLDKTHVVLKWDIP